MLTDKQKRFIELDKQKILFNQFQEQYALAIKELAQEMGINNHFQDDENTVYQIAELEGKFFHFERYEVKRTRRKDERAGSLSLIKAKELGYSVE